MGTAGLAREPDGHLEADLIGPLAPRRLAYHEMMAVLGVGDLHPGGRLATGFLLGELAKITPRRVLEVGAGIGLTTARMIKRGWGVTSIEPDPVLCARLAARLSVHAHEGSFESFEPAGEPYDAVIAEGVLYGLDLQDTLAKLRGLLRPEGLLAFTDMMWTEAANDDVAAFVHHQTHRTFGIPMVPRQVVTWPRWRAALRGAGFSEVTARRIESGDVASERRARRARLALGLLAHPRLLPLFLTYRLYNRITWAPPSWLESWMTVWRRA